MKTSKSDEMDVWKQLQLDKALGNFQIMCRACLKIHTDLFNIYERQNNEKAIFEKLIECTSIKVNKEDGLPMNICLNCLDKVNLAYDFRKMVVEIDKALCNFYIDKSMKKVVTNEDLLIKEEEMKSTDVSETNNISKTQLLLNMKYRNMSVKSDIKENAQKINNESNLSVISDTSKEFTLKNINKRGEKNEDVNMDTPIKSLNISEYQRLRKVLSEKEKLNTRLFCKECNKSFRFKYYFKVHLPQHIGQLPYKCNLCDKAFSIPYMLRKHQITHSNNKPYKCKVCEKDFKHQGGLQTHMSLHSGDLLYKCPVCSKAFRQNGNLTAHVRRHQPERAFVCEICGKSFVDKVGLLHHSETHNTEKKFVCSSCGKAYKTSKCLGRHIKSHAEVKDHKCTYCDKTFHTTYLLAQHVSTHTGERPYPCKFCDKTFRQRATLFRHVRVHTGESPFSCKLCPEKFKYSHHLASHVKVHHK